MDQKQNKKEQTPLLEVENFSLTFRHYREGLREEQMEVIRKLDVTIHEGEIVGIVGASGSGKSLLANAILGILPDHAETRGTLNYQGKALSRKKQIELRGKEIALIPQSINALDPLMKVGKQVQTVIKGRNRKAIQQHAFQKVGLKQEVADLYPFELSGGMARRVLVATAMVSEAKLIVADEPTPGMDPKSLEETLGHLKQLAEDGKGMMFITHDIEAALKIASKVAVFYDGQTVEIADVEDFSGSGENLRHPYTRALWKALPQNGFNLVEEEQLFTDDNQDGSAIYTNGAIAEDDCKDNEPELRQINRGKVMCSYA